MNLQFGGHGVGRTMHGDPHVPNDGRPGRGLKLKPGLVIAIEPWFLQTTDQIFTDADGWTLRSADGSRGAHMEHTIAITDDGPLVLTDRSGLSADLALVAIGAVGAKRPGSSERSEAPRDRPPSRGDRAEARRFYVMSSR